MGFTLVQLIKHRMSRERMKRRRDMEKRKERKTPTACCKMSGKCIQAKIVREAEEDVIKASSIVRGA